MGWKKIDNQSWSRGKERLYATEGEGGYVVIYEDENGESIIYKSNNWEKTLNHARMVSRTTGLIKEHHSVNN